MEKFILISWKFCGFKENCLALFFGDLENIMIFCNFFYLTKILEALKYIINFKNSLNVEKLVLISCKFCGLKENCLALLFGDLENIIIFCNIFI